jgi:hypothetical protein
VNKIEIEKSPARMNLQLFISRSGLLSIGLFAKIQLRQESDRSARMEQPDELAYIGKAWRIFRRFPMMANKLSAIVPLRYLLRNRFGHPWMIN